MALFSDDVNATRIWLTCRATSAKPCQKTLVFAPPAPLSLLLQLENNKHAPILLIFLSFLCPLPSRIYSRKIKCSSSSPRPLEDSINFLPSTPNMSDNQSSSLKSYIDSATGTVQSTLGSLTGNTSDQVSTAVVPVSEEYLLGYCTTSSKSPSGLFFILLISPCQDLLCDNITDIIAG